jgi:hypothetical protein
MTAAYRNLQVDIAHAVGERRAVPPHGQDQSRERRTGMARQAAARLQPVEYITDNAKALAPDDVLVHVRYRPDGEIFSIDDKPEGLSASQWLKHLFATASLHYQTFAGGRGFFRIPRSEFEALRKLASA